MRSFSDTLSSFKPLLSGRLPGQLVIQYSNRCNADCPQCSMRRSNNMVRSTLPLARAKALIDDAARQGVKSLSLTGGEPLMFVDEVVELIHHATGAGIPFVRTGTNGFIFARPESPDFSDRVSRLVEKLAATKLYTFWISLDSSVAADHERIRGLNTIIRGIEKALPIFHRHGIYPAANLGINRAVGGLDHQPFLAGMSQESFLDHFRQAFADFYQRVIDLGFTMANACYPMSSGATENAAFGQEGAASVYGAVSSDPMVTFSKQEKALLFRALFETIPKFRNRLRIFSPRCSLHGLIGKFEHDATPLFPCRGGLDFFFAECEQGLIHPCGYRQESSYLLPDLSRRLRDPECCNSCEWECFRDPSDLLGPFAELFTRPFSLVAKMRRDRQFFRLLAEDLRYYQACRYFDCRLAPDQAALKRFRIDHQVD